ncbi:hypothetical protein [Nonomuraea candida]|uniref:hypothetical protein n=1 Tax=Nonomuraea candida TaxID=359159 RepID=UPI0005BC90B4|nr:hypothetical protein [Nonomuraea candida]
MKENDVGRHAKPPIGKEQPQETQEESGSDEQRPSKGRHAKDRQRRSAPSADQAGSTELA